MGVEALTRWHADIQDTSIQNENAALGEKRVGGRGGRGGEECVEQGKKTTEGGVLGSWVDLAEKQTEKSRGGGSGGCHP